MSKEITMHIPEEKEDLQLFVCKTVKVQLIMMLIYMF